jgi:hypothetical protein
VVTIWLQALWQRARPTLKQGVWLVPIVGFAIASLIVPALPTIFVPAHAWIVGEEPELYEFMAQQPQDSLIASISEEANNLPAFAQRSILVGREFAIPFHLGYYQSIRQRAVDLIQAQYSPDLERAESTIEKYGIDFFLIDQDAFKPEYVSDDKWLQQYQPAAAQAVTALEQEKLPGLMQLRDRCSVFTNDRLFVLDAACLKQSF